jgi:hypothetical protein
MRGPGFSHTRTKPPIRRAAYRPVAALPALSRAGGPTTGER